MNYDYEEYDPDATISAPQSTTRATFVMDQPLDYAAAIQADSLSNSSISSQSDQSGATQAQGGMIDQPLLPRIPVEELDELLLNFAVCMGIPASNDREWNSKDPECALQDFMAIFNRWHSINQVHLTINTNFSRVNGVNIGARLAERAISEGRAHLLMPFAGHLEIMAEDCKKKIADLQWKDLIEYREFSAASTLHMWSMDRRFYEAAYFEVVRAARQESLRQYKVSDSDKEGSSPAWSVDGVLSREVLDSPREGGAAGRIQSMILAQNRSNVARGRPKVGEDFMAAMERGKGKLQDNDGNQCVTQ